jgi:hypothetical protein
MGGKSITYGVAIIMSPVYQLSGVLGVGVILRMDSDGVRR